METSIIVPGASNMVISDRRMELEAVYDTAKQNRGKKVLDLASKAARANILTSGYYNWKLKKAVDRYNKVDSVLQSTNLGGIKS